MNKQDNIKLLKAGFPSVNTVVLMNILKDCKGDFSKAVRKASQYNVKLNKNRQDIDDILDFQVQ